MNEIISKAITYIIIFLIYSVVLNVIRMIYTDIHSMNKRIDEANEAYDTGESLAAYLKLINLKRDVYFDVEESYTLLDKQTIGRAGNNDIVIDDPFLSKRNTGIYFKNNAYYIKDLGGKNGTSLNGEAVGGSLVRMSSGDRVSVGQLGFIFIDPEEDEGRYE